MHNIEVSVSELCHVAEAGVCASIDCPGIYGASAFADSAAVLSC